MLALILGDDELYSCLEYDLQAYQHMEMADFWRRKISVRRLITALRHFPSDSALASRGFAGDDRWSANDHLTADVIDQLQLLDWHFVSANSEKNKGPKLPEFIKRPDMHLKI